MTPAEREDSKALSCDPGAFGENRESRMTTRRNGDQATSDTEGHYMKWSNRDLKKDVKAVEPRAADEATDEATPDAEGHHMKWSNRDLKKDVKPVEPRATDEATMDAEGHHMKWSNRDLKKDVKPVERKTD